MTTLTTFLERTPASAKLAARANRVLPGGDTRSATHHPPYCLTFDRGEGAYLYDVDGHRYLDLNGNYTALVHGNAYPPVAAAISRAAEAGTAWSARSETQVRLAEQLTTRIDSVEQVRFTNSGTEANMLAVNLARHATGREMVLMAQYGYHGSYEDLERGSAGIAGPRTLLAPFGDAGAFEQLLEVHGQTIAAVLLEPVQGAAGIVAPPPSFLARVADACRRHDVLLVLDEVVTIRLAFGGAQSDTGIRPDLTTMGKLIGGGLPVGALGGRADLMTLLDPEHPRGVYHSGTFNGNPATTAAGLAALEALTPETIDHINRLGDRLAHGLLAEAARHQVPFSVRREGSLLNIYLDHAPSISPFERPDTAALAEFHLACLNRGLFFAPRGLMATSTVMTERDIDDALDQFAHALSDVAGALAHGQPRQAQLQ